MKLQIHFGRFDPSAKPDSTITLTNYKGWIKPAELAQDGIQVGDFMTCEDNYTILDGSKTEFPDNPTLHQWGWFSNTMSNNAGVFTTNIPTMDITFSMNHKSPGLTLYFYPFSDDYAKTVRATWYNAAGAVIHTGIYTLTSNVGVINESVEGFRRIKLEMLQTNLPYRYIKLYAIEYGISEVFNDDIIDTATLQESIDPISDTLEINTFRFSIKTHNAVFSLLTGEAEDGMLMRRQKITLTADGQPWGTYFLDSWGDNDGSEVHFSFTAQDAIGVMDGYKFMGGLYTDYPLSSLLDDIFAVTFPTGLIGYQLDSDLQGVRLNGYLPIMTCREAMQYACFVAGAVADTSRRDFVWVYKLSTEDEFSIGLDRIYIGTPVSPTDYYSGIDVTYYNYRQGEDSVNVFDGIMSAGQHRVEFSQPLSGVTVTGATVVSTHINYVDIAVASQRTVTISGKGYHDNPNVYSIRDSVAAGEVEAIAEFAGVGLVTSNNVATLAQNIFSYLKYRIRISPDMRLEGEEVGMTGKIETRRKPVRGVIESLNTNIRAQRAKAVIVGALEG